MKNSSCTSWLGPSNWKFLPFLKATRRLQNPRILEPGLFWLILQAAKQLLPEQLACEDSWQVHSYDCLEAEGSGSVGLFRWRRTFQTIPVYSPWQNYRKKMDGKMPGQPAIGKKTYKMGFWCPGIFPCPGKTVSIIKVSMILSVTAKHEFFQFFCRNSYL